MTTTPVLSIIVPTYQRCASVERALRALAQQTLPPADYEVIVVIDGATDDTREMVAQFPAAFALHAIAQPRQGRATACNTGIRAATGSIIVLLDDDMEPVPQFLAMHQQAHAAGSRVGVMGAVPIDIDHSSPPVVRYIGAKFNQHLAKLAQHGQPLTVRDFYSGNFSIGREVLCEAGLFDESFAVYGNEDLDLGVRLTRSGVRLLYDPMACARQYYEKDFAGLAQDNYAKGQTVVLLAAKQPQIYAQLKLSTYDQASRQWRAVRAGLLNLSRGWHALPRLVIRMVQLLERSRSDRLSFVYHFTTDYFFWLGVRVAQREMRPERKTGLTERANGV